MDGWKQAREREGLYRRSGKLDSPIGGRWLVASRVARLAFCPFSPACDGHLLGAIWEEKGIIGKRAFALAIGVITGFLVGVLFLSFLSQPLFLGVMPDVGARSHGVGVRGGWEVGRMEEREWGEGREERRGGGRRKVSVCHDGAHSGWFPPRTSFRGKRRVMKVMTVCINERRISIIASLASDPSVRLTCCVTLPRART